MKQKKEKNRMKRRERITFAIVERKDMRKFQNHIHGYSNP